MRASFISFLIRRLFSTIITLLVVATIIFFLFRQVGDPTVIFFVPQMGEEAVESIKAAFGLDEPLYIQYFKYLYNAITGNYGYSFAYMEPAAPIIFEKLINSLSLMIPALLLAYVIGPLAGVYLSWQRGIKEKLGMVVALVFRSTPIFWTGLVFLFLFSFTIPLFPVGGMRAFGADYSGFFGAFLSLDFLHHLILPVITMSLYFLGMPMLLMRTSMLEVINEDFVELCQAKGLKDTNIMYKHVARNAILPVMTLFAVAMTWAFGGNVLIEYLFSWPGIGSLMVKSILKSDYPVAQFSFLIMAFMVLIMNFLADILYGVLDPRVTYGKKRGE